MMKILNQRTRGVWLTVSLLFAFTLCPQAFAETVTNTYDTLNRLISVVYGNGQQITYTYDAAGNRTAMSGNTLTAPTAFTFTPLADVPLNTQIASNTITVSGVNAAPSITITGGEYSINGGTYTTVPGNVSSGDMVTVRLTSAATNSTTLAATLTIGGVNGTFNVTTTTSHATIPDAPTVVTATAGNAQAAVTFAMPANNGGSAITSYTVKSTPGNVTATGATLPIVVTGLSNGTAYTFTVTATNATGASAASAASNSVTPAAGVFTLTTEASRYRAIALDSANIYWTDIGNNAIKKISKNGGVATTLASSNPSALVIAVYGNYVYWAETNASTGAGSIKTVSVDGGTVYTLASSNTWGYYNGIRGLAVDSSGIYWAVSGNNSSGTNGAIMKLSGVPVDNPTLLAQTAPTILVSGLVNAAGLAIDNNDVYWIEPHTAVKKVNKNGGSVMILTSSSVEYSGIAVDATNVYFGTWNGNIYKVPLDGGSPTNLGGYMSGGFIAVDSDYVYYTDLWGGSVGRASINGAGSNILYSGEYGGSWGIAVDEVGVYWTTCPTCIAPSTGAVKKITKTNAGQAIGAISFSQATLAVGGTITASATATSGLAVSFSSTTPNVCSVSGSTVTGVAAGNCTIAANQAGNASYNAATQMTQTITVSGLTYGSALVLSNVNNLFGMIWGPGSNGIVLGGGLNYSTQIGVGWSQQYGGIFVTSYSIQGSPTQNYLTQTTPVSVTVSGPAGAIIEVWNLESMSVVATNITNPGSLVIFTAQPNHRYGGFAWYADNSQMNMAIYANLSGAYPVVGVQLPKTGQTLCYDSAGAAIACLGTGHDGAIQAGAAWPNPRFTDNGDSTVSDNLTGLAWTKNANLPASTRTWQQALDYVAGMNAGTYPNFGHTDWRLPNINELKSIIDSGQNAPALPGGAPFTTVSNNWYWSSTTMTVAPTVALIMNMGNGQVGEYTKTASGSTYYTGTVGYIWPVRTLAGGAIQIPKTGQTTSYAAGDDGTLQHGVAWPGSRFADSGNGTVTDNLTGVIWTKDANLPGTYKTWQQALDYVSGMNAGTYPNLGYTDWRLPNRVELESLINMQSHPFVNLQNVTYNSSTTVAGDPAIAWVVDPINGGTMASTKMELSNVWPVRGGSGTFTVVPLSVYAYLIATPSTITIGTGQQYATLAWSSINSTGCFLTGTGVSSATTGGTTNTPTFTGADVGTHTYTFSCSGAAGTNPAQQTATVTVAAAAPTPAPTITLTATPPTISHNATTYMTWSSTNSTSCQFTPGSVANGAPAGTATSGNFTTPNLTVTTPYTISCTGPGGTATQSTTVTVNPPTPAPTVTVTASPSTIASGQSSTITWTSTNATSCSSAGGGGTGATGAFTTPALAANTTYTVSCSGPGGGPVSGSATVTVPVTPIKALTELLISGPAALVANGSGTYTAIAVFNDASWVAVAPAWSFTGTAASFANGILTAGNVTANGAVSISASYSEGGITKTASLPVTIQAVASPPAHPPQLIGLAITGAASINEGTTGSYSLVASYGDGTTAPVTGTLSLAATAHAALTGTTLSAALVAADQVVTLNASYSEGGITMTAALPVTVKDVTGTTLNLATGWNLLGNGTDAPLDVTAILGDTAKVTTVWKWIPAATRWAFYAPSMTGPGLATYAASKNYDVLSTINGGEGFWVNAKVASTITLPAGNVLSATSFQETLVQGWNLIAIGEAKTPSQFNSLLSVTPPSPGVVPVNLTTLWAWDNELSSWYFYAPSLEANGGLANYITGKNYLDFTARGKMLGQGVGFWVNRP